MPDHDVNAMNTDPEGNGRAVSVAIVGSRDFPDLVRVERLVWQLHDTGQVGTIISGRAKGVDQRAEKSAEAAEIAVVSFYPREVHGRIYIERSDSDGERFVDGTTYKSWGHAAFCRNVLIVKHAGQVVAFWDGTSKGTKHTIDMALAYKKPLEVRFP